MKNYSVKQIAEMLNTNPETVRRWIRTNKMKAVQVSRKDGNIVTEAELKRFAKATPKYLPRLITGMKLPAISPAVGIGALAGNIVASALLGYFSEKNRTDIRVRPQDFKNYLEEDIAKLKERLIQKQALIRQTEAEIDTINRKIEQYNYLLENEDLLVETLEKATTNTED